MIFAFFCFDDLAARIFPPLVTKPFQYLLRLIKKVSSTIQSWFRFKTGENGSKSPDLKQKQIHTVLNSNLARFRGILTHKTCCQLKYYQSSQHDFCFQSEEVQPIAVSRTTRRQQGRDFCLFTNGACNSFTRQMSLKCLLFCRVESRNSQTPFSNRVLHVT